MQKAKFAARTSLRWFLLITILATGLYLRVANLSQVQLFEADEGYYCLEMVKWLKEGHWPLLGPLRRTGDHTIGPGFYYVLAPLMWITHIHPSSGAATVGVLNILAVFLAYLWLKRAAANEAAAIALAFLLAVSPGWVTMSRYSNPIELLPVLTIVIAFLLDRMTQHPVSSIALLSMTWAFIPHTLTAGLLLFPPSVIVAIHSFMRGRMRIHETSRGRPLLWFVIVFVALCVLYIPPILYELKPGPGNFEQYIRNTFSSRVRFAALEKPVSWMAMIDFSIDCFLGSMVWYRISFPLMKLLYFCSLAYALPWSVFRERRPSLIFMILLLAEFFLVPLIYGHPGGFYLTALVPLPPLLISFLIASLPGLLEGGRQRNLLRILSFLGILLMFGTAVLSFRISRRVPDGATGYGDSFARMQRVAAHILQQQKGRPYSFVVAPDGYSADYQYLLWFGGNRPQNREYRPLRISTEQGEALYVLFRQGQHRKINCNSWMGDYQATVVERVLIYRIPFSSIPAGVSAVRIQTEGSCVNLHAEP